jgi:hypothetical protein
MTMNPKKTPWLRYTVLTLVLLIIGVLAFVIYTLFIYDPFASWEIGRIEPILSEVLRPTAEYLSVHPQPTPQGIDHSPQWTVNGKICFATLSPTKEEWVDLEVYLNGSLVPKTYYGWNGTSVLSRDPRAGGTCIDPTAINLPTGLHLLEWRMTRQGQATEIYQWAVRVESEAVR